jgi:DNA-directed RNA polymerase specialized sigma24 family protein
MQKPRGTPGYRFPTTQWTNIEDTGMREILKAEIYERYMPPLYHYSRRKGYSHENAEDFVQGFLTEILLGREFLSKADRTKGKFRSLLLKSFDRYVCTIHRKKRLPIGSSNDISEFDLPETIPQDPVSAFDYAWATSILDRVQVDLEHECQRDGLDVHWAIFKEKVLDPLMENTPVPSLTKLCREHAVATTAQASSMIVTVKRRFRKILERYLPGDDMFRDFIGIFSCD